MDREHWKAAAIVLAGLLLVTNAAGFYTRRVMASESVERDHEVACTRQAPTPLPEPQVIVPSTLDAAPVVMPNPNERCIGGRLFHKYGNEWTDAGNC